MKKHYFSFVSFLLIFTIFVNVNSVFARDWSDEFVFNAYNISRYIDLVWGFVFDHNANTTEDLVTKFYRYGQESDKWKDKVGKYHTIDSFSDWWRSNLLPKDSNGNDCDVSNADHIEFTNEFKSYLYDFSQSYAAELDQQQAYTYKTTFSPSTLLKGSNFYDLDSFNNTKAFLESLCSRYDYVFIADSHEYGNLACDFTAYGLTVSQLGIASDTLYIKGSTLANYCSIDVSKPLDVYYFNCRDNKQYKFSSFYDFSHNADNIETYSKGKGSKYIYFKCFNGISETKYITEGSGHVRWTIGSPFLYNAGYIITKTPSKVKCFTSLQDLLDYQANTLTPPYYKVTPTCSGNTITKNDIDNSVRYGDINNQVITYIINHGGITEEQLQRLIEAILAGRGGGSSDPITDPVVDPIIDPDPSPFPSPDFSGLLKGLMTLLSSIFGLLSSLIGYFAELLRQLISSLTGIIDNIKLLISDGVMGIFTAVFPFLPPEVTSLLTVTFLLCAIIAIIKFIRG